MRDHFLYKFLHFPCINSHLTAFALASLLTPTCQEKDLKPPTPNTNTDDERIHSFYKQRVSVALQRVQVAIILDQAVLTAGEASYRLGVLPGFFYHLLA